MNLYVARDKTETPAYRALKVLLAAGALLILGLFAFPAPARAQTLTQDNVPYTTLMWSDSDPYGFQTLSNLVASGDVTIGPRLIALEGRTNTWNAAAASVAAGDANWDAAFSWGNHALAGYLARHSGTSTNQTLVGATVADKLSFNLAFAETLSAGQIAWDPDWQTFRAGLPDGVTGQFFQESQIYAKNASGQVVTNGMAVMQSDAVGNSSKLEFVLAQASVGARSSMTLGVATHDIAVGAFGKITWFGNVNEIDTTGALYGESGWTNNMPVYVSTNKPGFLTKHAPEAPYPRITVGAVGNAHAHAGNVFVRPTWGLRLSDLDDVDGTPLTSTGQIPVWDNGRQVFDFDRNVNEFLLASVWNNWLSTNTYVKMELDQTALSALAAFAATNKTKVVYSAVSSNVWATLGVGGTVTVHTVVAAQVPDPDNIVVDDPHDVFDGTYQNQGGGVYWFNSENEYIAITATSATLFTSGDTAAYGGDGTVPPFEFQEALNGFPLPVPTTSFALKAGYVTNSVPYVLTTGNVWQAVADVQQTADDAMLAADQAATLINYHTTLDAAPHAGKFVTPAQMTNNTSHVLSQWYAADGSLTQQIVRAGTEIWTNRWPAGVAGAITNGMAGVTLDGLRIINSMILSNGTARAELYHDGSQTVIDSKNGNIYFSLSGGLISFVDSTGLNVNDNKVIGFGGNVDASIGKVGDKFVIQTKSLYGTGTLDLLIPSGNLCVSNDVCTAGKIKFGPTIDGKQAHTFTDGTNDFFVDVNSKTNKFAFDTIVKPVVTSATNVVVTSNQSVYSVALTVASNVGVDFSNLALGGVSNAAVTLYLDCQTTQALASVFNTNSVTFDMPWEPTVTGRYEIAVSSDGVRTTARQAWPKNDTPQFGYVKYNYAASASSHPDMVAIADGSTNGAVYTWVSCPNCWYAVRAQFNNGHAGDTVTFGYFRNAVGFGDYISSFVSETSINPDVPYGFTTGWIFVPPPSVWYHAAPGAQNGCGLWITRNSSIGYLRCSSIEVRKANILEIRAAQVMGL